MTVGIVTNVKSKLRYNPYTITFSLISDFAVGSSNIQDISAFEP